MTLLKDLAANADVATAIGGRGPLSGLPSPGVINRRYEATDVGVIYWDTGSGWVPVPVPLNPGALSARPLPAVAGREYEATDVGVVYRDTGSTWQAVALFRKTGPFASLPAAGVEGREYRTTDTFTLYRDNGGSWEPINAAPGDVKWTANGAAPAAGWVLANGAAVTRTGLYAALFAAIGTAHGAGNGTSTFNLPDMQGRVPLGAGSGGGLTTRTNGQRLGEEAHKLSEQELPVLKETFDLEYNMMLSSPGAIVAYVQPSAPGEVGAVPLWAGNLNPHPMGSGNTHNNMQPATVLAAWVKL